MSFVISLFLNSNTGHASKVVIMRHGHAEHNIKKVYNSNPEDPSHEPSNLTELGKKQVEKTGRELLRKGITRDVIDVVIVSPFLRAKQTAEILVHLGVIDATKIKYDDGFKELLVLNREGKVVADYEGLPWDGETFGDVRERVVRSFEKNSCPKKNILIVTHGVPGNLLADHLQRGKSERLKPAQAYIIDIDD